VTHPNRRRRVILCASAVLTAAAIWGIVSVTAKSTPVANGKPTSSTAAPSTATTAKTATTSKSTKTATQQTTIPAVPVATSAEVPSNVYSETSKLQPAIAGDPARVYVPSGLANTLTVIDQRTRKVLSTFRPGSNPQHVVPSYDLRTLWILNNKGNSVVPITAATGSVGGAIPVSDPYNLYFTPDGKSAIVVAEKFARLDFRDPQTMKPQSSLAVRGCTGINHADFSPDGSYMIATCEFAGKVAKIDMLQRKVVGLLALQPPVHTAADHMTMTSMPQDIRLAPDGKRFFVADMAGGGLHILDGDSFTEIGFIPTGVGTHGITPSHDGTKFYVSNRGSATTAARPKGPGSVSVVDVATDKVIATWPVPGGGSPDMGNLTADGKELWLSGRYDAEVYAFDTSTGLLLARIPVATGPHGLTVWPQAGRYSLGHTGNMR
jgi:DNA-binding beta-propeller fold protein YncE